MRSTILFGLALLASVLTPLLAQERPAQGRMWTFEDPPLGRLEKEHGFKPDAKWLSALRLGSLRLGGGEIESGFGSASFVSPEGLILTSSHCVRELAVSTEKPIVWMRKRISWMMQDGFVAASRGDELRLRTLGQGWLSAAQLIKTSDVTGKVYEGVEVTDGAAAIQARREANRRAILAAARDADPDLVPQIVSFHRGATCRLYQYRVYDDVRLVVLPRQQEANFGGDFDDLTYPRHVVDFVFLRAYENGEPADTSRHHLAWGSGDAQEDELVFVSGNPGTTSRMSTLAQVEYERDVALPMLRQFFESRLGVWRDVAIMHEWPTEVPPYGLQSGLKETRALQRALEDPALMARKAASEREFRRRIEGDETLAKRFAGLWNRVARVVEERRRHEARLRFQTQAGLFPFDSAVTIVQAHDPAESEDVRRGARTQLAGWGDGRAGIPNGEARLLFIEHVKRARRWLPADDPYFSKVLAGRTAEEFLQSVIGPPNAGHNDGPELRSLVYHPKRWQALVATGWKGILASKDPAIVAARELAVLLRRTRKIREGLVAREAALDAELGRAWMASYGDLASPDGTLTPRFTDGVIRGLLRNGTVAPHRTTFFGLFGRNAAFGDEFPFTLPKDWLDRSASIDMTTTLNFASTHDIARGHKPFEVRVEGMHRRRFAGGSSGSVVVNRALEVVGVVVDGNRESSRGVFETRDRSARAVSVHVDAIILALRKILRAEHVAKELAGG